MVLRSQAIRAKLRPYASRFLNQFLYCGLREQTSENPVGLETHDYVVWCPESTHFHLAQFLVQKSGPISHLTWKALSTEDGQGLEAAPPALLPPYISGGPPPSSRCPILRPLRMQHCGTASCHLGTYRQNRGKTKPLLLHLITSFHIINSLESERRC